MTVGEIGARCPLERAFRTMGTSEVKTFASALGVMFLCRLGPRFVEGLGLISWVKGNEVTHLIPRCTLVPILLSTFGLHWNHFHALADSF